MQGEAITGMRSSLCLLGALLGRCGYVTMEHPGGCIIGERPIDLHIRALQQMGVEFREEEGLLSAQVKDGKMHGAEITLEFPSVGATENILLAAVKADGDTRILGAAREPEVTALCEFLTACGAQIEGIGETELLVHGDRPLHGTQFTVPADRIVAGTYLFACIGCGGSTLLTEAPWEQMEAVTFVAEKMGAQCIASEEGLFVQCSKRPQAIPVMRPANTATATGMPLFSTTYMTTPHTTMMLPMDRSMPPEIRRMLMAMVRIPSTQICWKMATMLPRLMKFGLMTEMTTMMIAITMASSTR